MKSPLKILKNYPKINTIEFIFFMFPFLVIVVLYNFVIFNWEF